MITPSFTPDDLVRLALIVVVLVAIGVLSALGWRRVLHRRIDEEYRRLVERERDALG